MPPILTSMVLLLWSLDINVSVLKFAWALEHGHEVFAHEAHAHAHEHEHSHQEKEAGFGDSYRNWREDRKF